MEPSLSTDCWWLLRLRGFSGRLTDRVLNLVRCGMSRWGTTIREERTAIVKSKKEDQPDVPVVSEELLTIKWIDLFIDHLKRCIGICYVLSVCVVCKRWMSTLFCHIVSRTKLTALSMDLSWMNGLFRQDNAAVYYKIEEAVRGTNYADSIKPFQARKDGRGAFLSSCVTECRQGQVEG